MSILIKGMEMPKSCRACMFSRTDILNTDWCVLTEKYRPCDCPLIPVPPHGRLIDADELMERFSYSPGDTAEDRIWIRAARRIIIEAPTIIPAEEGEG